MDPEEILVSIFSPDLERMEEGCREDRLYKYYSFNDTSFQKRFLASPTVKFTQKSDLNDPFELTKRWHQFGSPPTLSAFQEYLRQELEHRLADDTYITQQLLESPEFKSSGWSKYQLKAKMRSPEYSALLKHLKQEMQIKLGPFIQLLFAIMESDSDAQIDKIARQMGIFSLTETAINRAMWGLYANSGQGFVLEFDAQHEFFKKIDGNGNERNVLRKVFYRDDRIDDFWRNPYFLFLVKNSEFSFEKEWRMMSKIDQCNKVDLGHGREIYLKDAPKGMIKSIIAGYRHKQHEVFDVFSPIWDFDPSISLKQVVPNSISGEFDVVEVSH